MVQFHFQEGLALVLGPGTERAVSGGCRDQEGQEHGGGDGLQDRTLDYVELLVPSMSRTPCYTSCTPNSLIHPTKSPKPATGTHLLMDPKAMSLLCAGGRASHFSHNDLHY